MSGIIKKILDGQRNRKQQPTMRTKQKRATWEQAESETGLWTGRALTVQHPVKQLKENTEHVRSKNDKFTLNFYR